MAVHKASATASARSARGALDAALARLADAGCEIGDTIREQLYAQVRRLPKGYDGGVLVAGNGKIVACLGQVYRGEPRPDKRPWWRCYLKYDDAIRTE